MPGNDGTVSGSDPVEKFVFWNTQIWQYCNETMVLKPGLISRGICAPFFRMLPFITSPLDVLCNEIGRKYLWTNEDDDWSQSRGSRWRNDLRGIISL